MKVSRDLKPDEEAKAAKAVAAVVKTEKDSTLTRATDVIMENEGWRPIWMDVKPIDNEALILKDLEKHVDRPLLLVQLVVYVFFGSLQD